MEKATFLINLDVFAISRILLIEPPMKNEVAKQGSAHLLLFTITNLAFVGCSPKLLDLASFHWAMPV